MNRISDSQERSDQGHKDSINQDQEHEDSLYGIGQDEEEGKTLQKTNQKKEASIPSRKLMKRLMKDQFKYDRKRLIFLCVNSVTLVITMFNLISSINIEGQNSLIQYEDTAEQMLEMDGFSINYLITLLNLVHLIKMFSCLVGFFAVNQKSDKLITYYMVISSAALILRAIVTLLLIISYGEIEDVCTRVFKDDDVGQYMAIQYISVLSVFVLVEIFLSLVSLVQGSQSKEEYISKISTLYQGFKKYHNRLLKKYMACFEIALQTFQ